MTRFNKVRSASGSFFGAALLFAVTLPASAQQTANPMSAWLKTAYTNNHNGILRMAEKMPEENYGMRPGSQQEVRTFGQQVGHVARYNFLWCSQAKGEKNPAADRNPETLATKAELIKALNDAFTYCDEAYNALT